MPEKESFGMLRSIKLCSEYKKMTHDEQEKLRKMRLKKIVDRAKHSSPYLAGLYKDISDDFELSDLPPTNKSELMKHWDEWVTDSDLKLSDAEEFMKNPDNIGRKLNGKYVIFTTSGSTGNPLVAVCDDSTNNVMSAINVERTFARKEDLTAFMKRGGKTIGIFANGGFYLGNSSVRARLLSMPWKKRQMAVTSALLPTEKIVEQLNAFKPTMLGGYPSNLELLIDEKKSGRLNISPVIIMTGGEYLSEDLRKRLAEAFGCYVQTSYSCTEGGTVACECTEHHFHINDDWLIIEAVDSENRPVPDGQLSDKILLTNMFNFTQPFIRYEVTDRIVMHHEPCKCGNTSPWLTIEGRTDDVTTFTSGEKEIKIPPLAIYATLKEVHELRRFQLIVRHGNKAVLRFIAADGVDRVVAFEAAKAALKAFLAEHGVTEVTIEPSDEAPTQHPKSGKFKHIIREE